MPMVGEMEIIDNRKIQNLLDIVDPRNGTIDLGICRSDMVAIAGTGTYKSNVGKLRPDTLLSQVVKSGKPLILENRNRSAQCMKCSGKMLCPYKGVVYYPLKVDDVTLGAIYLMSKNVLSNDAEMYSEFLRKLSSFTMEFIASSRTIFENEKYVNCLINLSPDGLITTSPKGLIRNINTSAKKIFNILSHDQTPALNIRHLLPNLHLDSLGATYRYKDRYKVKIRNIEDTGYILKISSDIRFDLKKLDFIIGNSEAIKTAKERASVIAKYDLPALLLGETGSGKELFAQGIHYQSSRGTKNLTTIDCSSIPGNLLESELFGYVEGAFTGAKSGGKKGKIEVSNMSSIFLDEIGEIPLHLQTKLLRLIDNNSFDKLGDTRTTYVNTRIIAATNRDLRKMVQEGTFRKDLYYRLNVMQLEIPPLRVRGDDINMLSDYFLNIYNVKFKKNILLDDTIRSLFIKYEWPGNVRELKNLISYCVAFSDDDLIKVESLPDWFKESIMSMSNEKNFTRAASVASAEKNLIEKSLMLYGNSTKEKMQAAKALGISLPTLYRKMKMYNLH